MKTIGLIGGLSWESTAVYYRLINQRVRAERGGLSSASLLLHSFDFDEIVRLQQADAWTEAAERLSDAARGLCASGARCVAICTNTMHKVAPEVMAAIPVDAKLLHIGDAAGEAICAAGIRRVGLLGTRYTMIQPFLSAYLTDNYGLEVVVPKAADREIVHEIIFGELCRGVVLPESREALVDVARRLRDDQGAEGVILGCTELMLAAGEETGEFPLLRFDTTALHAQAIADYALHSPVIKDICNIESATSRPLANSTRTLATI